MLDERLLAGNESLRPAEFTVEHARAFLEANRVQAVVLNPIVTNDRIPAYKMLKNGDLVPDSFKHEQEDRESGKGVVEYPESVLSSITRSINRYARAYNRLVQREREVSGQDMAYAAGNDPDGNFVNWGLQIDMAALPKAFLDIADQLPEDVLDQVLMERVFEFENSLARYNFMRMIFMDENGNSEMMAAFDGSLESIREYTGKKIAVATLTEKKYNAIRAEEMMLQPGELASEELTRERIGFDQVMSPSDLEAHLKKIQECKIVLDLARFDGDISAIEEAERKLAEADDTIFYVRSSLPVSKLINPNAELDLPDIYQQEKLLRLLRERSLTPNVDLPGSEALPLNDTKEYMEELGMAVIVRGLDDLFSEELLTIAETNLLDRKIERVKNLLGAVKSGKPNPALEKAGYSLDELQGKFPNAANLLSLFKAITRRDIGTSFKDAMNYFLDRTDVTDESERLAIIRQIDDLLDLVTKTESISIADSIAQVIEGLEQEDLASIFTDKLRNYLASKGQNVDDPNSLNLRLKPMVLSYGAYGHIRGSITSPKVLRELLTSLQERGIYVLQNEVPALRILDYGPVLRGELDENESPILSPIEYGRIDRLFFLYNPYTGEYEFASGFANHLKMTNSEAKKNTIHGQKDAVYTKIVRSSRNAKAA